MVTYQSGSIFCLFFVCLFISEECSQNIRLCFFHKYKILTMGALPFVQPVEKVKVSFFLRVHSKLALLPI